MACLRRPWVRLPAVVGCRHGVDPRRRDVPGCPAVAGGGADTRPTGGVGGDLCRMAALAAVRAACGGAGRPAGPAAGHVGRGQRPGACRGGADRGRGRRLGQHPPAGGGRLPGRGRPDPVRERRPGHGGSRGRPRPAAPGAGQRPAGRLPDCRPAAGRAAGRQRRLRGGRLAAVPGRRGLVRGQRPPGGLHQGPVPGRGGRRPTARAQPAGRDRRGPAVPVPPPAAPGRRAAGQCQQPGLHGRGGRAGAVRRRGSSAWAAGATVCCWPRWRLAGCRGVCSRPGSGDGCHRRG